MLQPFSMVILISALLSSGVVNASEISKDPTPPKKLLVLTFSGGFKHKALEPFEKLVAQMGKDSGIYEATCLEQWKLEKDEIDLSFLTKDYLAQFDGIVSYTTTGDLEEKLLTPEQKAALLDFVKSGKAFIGVHTATDSFYNWADYGEMVGGYFAGHPWGAGDPPVTIKIEDKNHPATKMLPEEWVIQDEIYQNKEPYSRKNLHVLMSLDTTKTDMNKKNLYYGPEGDYAIAWCRLYGEGKVFYTALGHRDEVLADPLYQQHLLGGIKWALGLEPGDAPPSEK